MFGVDGPSGDGKKAVCPATAAAATAVTPYQRKLQQGEPQSTGPAASTATSNALHAINTKHAASKLKYGAPTPTAADVCKLRTSSGGHVKHCQFPSSESTRNATAAAASAAHGTTRRGCPSSPCPAPTSDGCSSATAT